MLGERVRHPAQSANPPQETYRDQLSVSTLAIFTRCLQLTNVDGEWMRSRGQAATACVPMLGRSQRATRRGPR